MTTKEQFQSCENNVLLNHIFCNIKIIFTNKKTGYQNTCTKRLSEHMYQKCYT